MNTKVKSELTMIPQLYLLLRDRSKLTRVHGKPEIRRAKYPLKYGVELGKAWLTSLCIC